MTLTEAQLYLGFTAVGWPPRRADISAAQMLGGTVEVLAEYIWDHVMGEPDEPTCDDVEKSIQLAIDQYDQIVNPEAVPEMNEITLTPRVFDYVELRLLAPDHLDDTVERLRDAGADAHAEALVQAVREFQDRCRAIRRRLRRAR